MSVLDDAQIDLEADIGVKGNEQSQSEVTTNQNTKTFPWIEKVIRSKRDDPQ
jgi:hypothetical protein